MWRSNACANEMTKLRADIKSAVVHSNIHSTMPCKFQFIASVWTFSLVKACVCVGSFFLLTIPSGLSTPLFAVCEEAGRAAVLRQLISLW